MKFKAVSKETRLNYIMWSIKQEIDRENKFLSSLGFDPQPIIDIVKQFIDHWDPIGMLETDSPADEYDGETQTIAIYILMHSAEIDEEAVSKTINKIFSNSFKAEFIKGNESLEMTRNIISLLRSRNLI